MTTVKFHYNGIKVTGQPLHRVQYVIDEFTSYPKGTITIYGQSFARFAVEVRKWFEIDKDNVIFLDQYIPDIIRVFPAHPMYATVKSAADKAKAKQEAKRRK